MRFRPFFAAALVVATLAGCSSPSPEETYLQFLYANLSLPDRVDYDTAYYRSQVRLALEARSTMAWGDSIPESYFRHFVLPPRVNNEDLDTSRAVFFRALQPRVQGLSMRDAILEVNHWCHEHVTYRPTNARTLSPLATLRTAYGRCGEESVFTVAALRSVGIPARQVYTPRWAHTDDNHAWVEAWADGRWWFLGACEPEPVLNMGWFNESASRGILMHTKVFGDYNGPEEVVRRQPVLTEINVIDNYAPARRFTVVVTDSLDRPVADAAVEFKVYNYAEFYTVARKQSDSAGRASLTAGLGDMLVWASSPAGIAFRQVSFARDSLVTLRLSHPAHVDLDLDITPPGVSVSLPEVTAEQRAANDLRLATEDSLRHAYESTLPDARSRGNYAVVAAFRDSASARGQQFVAEQLLEVLPDKDLQDVTLDVLFDNLPPDDGGARAHHDVTLTDVVRSYVLSPRIERERLTAYKSTLRAVFAGFDVSQLIAWTRDSLTLVTDQNPQQLRMQPLGAYRFRTTDALGRDIFFVAACRAIDIPARINEINGKVQYFADGTWADVTFDAVLNDGPSLDGPTASETSAGSLMLTYSPAPHLPDAIYYSHFTISRLSADGTLQLLTYPEEATFDNTFSSGVSLDAGTYLLTTGLRLADGSVRAHLTSFVVRSGETTTLPLTLRPADDAVAVIGSLNAEDIYNPLTSAAAEGAAPTSLLATCGRGYYALGIISPNHEPTNHALRDISRVCADFETWGRSLVLLFEDESAATRFNFDEFSSLPSTTVWGIDPDGAIMEELRQSLHLSSGALPVFVICDSFNRVVFVQQGYTIGLGEQMVKVIKQL